MNAELLFLTFVLSLKLTLLKIRHHVTSTMNFVANGKPSLMTNKKGLFILKLPPI